MKRENNFNQTSQHSSEIIWMEKSKVLNKLWTRSPFTWNKVSATKNFSGETSREGKTYKMAKHWKAVGTFPNEATNNKNHLAHRGYLSFIPWIGKNPLRGMMATQWLHLRPIMDWKRTEHLIHNMQESVWLNNKRGKY